MVILRQNNFLHTVVFPYGGNAVNVAMNGKPILTHVLEAMVVKNVQMLNLEIK